MGFSTTICSLIVMFGLMAAFGLVTSAAIHGALEISNAVKDYVAVDRARLDVKLELEINEVNESSCLVTVKNVGSRIVFFKSQHNFNWNTIIISYGNGSNWLTYTVEDYTIIEVRVMGSSVSFSPEGHAFLAPGEEAVIYFELPQDAPKIPLNGVLTVTFVSHYGVQASREGVRT